MGNICYDNFISHCDINQLLSYRLLLQASLKFLWRIYYINKNQFTRNFSKKYQQNFLLDTVFFEQ